MKKIIAEIMTEKTGAFKMDLSHAGDVMKATDRLTKALHSMRKDGNYLVLSLEPMKVAYIDTDVNKIVATKVYEVDEAQETESTETGLESPTMDEQPQGNTKYRVIPIKTKYVGQDVLIRVLQYDGEPIIWLPLTVNDFPPRDAINAEALAKLLTQVYIYGMGLDPGAVAIVTPPADITDEAQAVEYVEDYIKACKEVHQVEKKTARAWLGHRLEGQEG